jgi:hypothetical protein
MKIRLVPASFVCYLLTCLSIMNGQCQSIKWDIQKVDLRDTLLIDQVRRLIVEETENDSLFRKMGYINVYANSFSKNDTLRSYFINTNFDDKLSSDGSNSYPHFYTMISGRLICYYLTILSDAVSVQFSKKTIKKFRTVLSRHLPKDKLNELFKTHGGKHIYIMENNELIVSPSKY